MKINISKSNKVVFIIIGAVLLTHNIQAQIQLKVGDNPTVINSNAVLELESKSKGFLLPRMTTTERNLISSPSTGLIIFNTTTNCTEYFNGVGWINECDRSLSISGSSGGTATITSMSSSLGCSVGAGTNNSSPPGTVRAGVNQTMIQGISATGVATITINVIVSGIGTYQIFTDTINGVTFSASGNFTNTGNQTVTLNATGIPTFAGNYKWTITYNTYTLNAYGSVITANAPLGSSYTAHFNGIDSSGNSINSSSASYSSGEIFSENTSCQNKPISAQGCGGVTSVITSSGRAHVTVDINGQCWLKTNLITKPTVYSNYLNSSWTNSTPGDQGYWGYYNSNTPNGSAGWGTSEPTLNQGLLYQWCGAMDATISERSRGVCPTGWHIPSDCEWMYLEHGIGMKISEQNSSSLTRASGSTISYKLRAFGTATNTGLSNFSGIITGFRNYIGNFYGNTTTNYAIQFWSSSFENIVNPRTRAIGDNDIVFRYSTHLRSDSMSIRCLKD